MDPCAEESQELRRVRADNAALREQLALRNHALDATQSFFVISELIDSERHTIAYCNKRVADQLGVPREQLIGQDAGILTGWDARNTDYRSRLSASLRSGQIFHYEDDVIREDGRKAVLGVTITPVFGPDGQVTHAVAIGADITAKREEARKKQELQDQLVAEMKERERVVLELQLAQKLESVGRLAAGIAHEINTPIQYVGDSVQFLRSAYDDLTGLINALRQMIESLSEGPTRGALRSDFSGLLEKHDVDFIRAEVPRAFERTFDGVERVTTIVKAMKEFAHPDAEEQSPADLNHAIETTLLVASNEYKYSARILTDFGALPPVVCNVGELNQVILNLIVNAAHAIHDAGKDAETGEIRIGTELEGNMAVIRVRDNGCGIPKENISKLYDPFFTTKEVGRGTGQGLSIAHSILVDRHGGDISVSSQVGHGTEFVLRVPINGRTAGGGPMKNIVFVDDERELLDGLRARLYKHRNEWRMQFVLSGEEAITVFEKEPVDLIVSDVRMPGMDGGQLLSTVQQRWPTTTRIIISGYSDPARALRLASLAHQYLAKPCEERQVENVIERCFHLQDLLSQESLRRVVGRIGKLPAMPKTFAKLQNALAQPSVTAGEIGDIVSADAAIATKVLQITNSAFFRLRKPMVRIKDAVTYLGFATVRNLVLCAEISSNWESPPELPDIDPQDLQMHAEYSAAACKALAGGRVSPDDAWLAGLLHDIGYWILVQECPQQLAEAIALAKADGMPLFECELKTIGATHAEMGAYLLGLWGLPYPIVEAVALHHTPTTITPHGYDLLAALAVAHTLMEPENAHAISVMSAGKPAADAGYLAGLGAPFDWEEAERRVRASAAPAN